MFNCSFKTTAPDLVETFHRPMWAVAQPAAQLKRATLMDQTQSSAASASHHISTDWIFLFFFFAVPEGARCVCAHLKLDSWLQFVHPSAVVSLS